MCCFRKTWSFWFWIEVLGTCRHWDPFVDIGHAKFIAVALTFSLLTTSELSYQLKYSQVCQPCPRSPVLLMWDPKEGVMMKTRLSNFILLHVYTFGWAVASPKRIKAKRRKYTKRETTRRASCSIQNMYRSRDNMGHFGPAVWSACPQVESGLHQRKMQFLKCFNVIPIQSLTSGWQS